MKHAGQTQGHAKVTRSQQAERQSPINTKLIATLRFQDNRFSNADGNMSQAVPLLCMYASSMFVFMQTCTHMTAATMNMSICLNIMQLFTHLVDIISSAVYPIPTFKTLIVEIGFDCILFIAASSCSLSSTSASQAVLSIQAGLQTCRQASNTLTVSEGLWPTRLLKERLLLLHPL